MVIVSWLASERSMVLPRVNIIFIANGKIYNQRPKRFLTKMG